MVLTSPLQDALASGRLLQSLVMGWLMISGYFSIWAAIFEWLGLQPGLVRDENTRETAVTELQRVVQADLQATVVLVEQTDVQPSHTPCEGAAGLYILF